ncbi:MAG: Holliday junction branch migration protein RuvA [Holosporales bacterium]|jgi:Holliday junction DNA helicase RuvA|nr:Holliday junction branch migration protein RuvA [Holosporales bacterium]
MIAKIKGIVEDIFEDSLIVDVRGIGYQVYVTSRFLASLNSGDNLTIRTLHIFKQEQQFLFGFQSSSELNLFKNLLRVHGIGTRSALSIVSLLSPEEFATAIATQDPDILLRASGIGRKTASRILLELKDMIIKSEDCSVGQGETAVSDAVLGLISLGYKRNEILRVLNRVTKAMSPISTDEIIISCLRELK